MIGVARSALGALVLGAVLATHVSGAELVVVDLARENPGTRIERTTSPGTVTVRFVNRAPKLTYSWSLVRRTQAIAAFPEAAPLFGAQPATDDDCAKQLKEEFHKLKTEQEVAEWLSSGKPGKCTAEERRRRLAGFRERSTIEVPVSLAAGEEVTLVLSRPGENEVLQWTVKLSTQARGEWITTYGVAITPSRDELFGLDPAATSGEFVVVPHHRRRSEVVFQPAIFFTWLSSKYALADYAWGPTAGFGAGSDTYSIFLGWSALYNWNIQLSGGISAFQAKRLNAKYREGDTVRESLSDDQLHRKVGWLGWHFGLTWRFAENPFKNGEKREDQKPEADAGAKP